MKADIHSIDWENKPKLRHKWLSLLFVIMSAFVLYYGYGYANHVYQKHTANLNATIDMRALAKDLVNLEIAPLDSLEVNQRKLDLLYNIGLGDVEIKYPDTEGNKPLVPNSDNIGNFYRVEIVFFGDMYEQMYFLQKFDFFRDFIMMDSINANQRNIIVKARLYGQ